MDIVQTITSIAPFDWLVVGFAVAMFVVGFAQGVVRRLLGIVSIAFSFLLAANLRDTLGSFLATNWTQFPREYAYMIAFGILFVLASVIFALVIQSFYKRAPIFAKYPVARRAPRWRARRRRGHADHRLWHRHPRFVLPAADRDR